MAERTVRLVLGPPGTGKTTYLVGEVRKLLEQGVPANQIAYVAFTRRAAWEARDRLAFDLGLQKDDLVNVRTLHSLAYSRLGLTPNRVMSREHWNTFGVAIGESFGITPDEDGRIQPLSIRTDGDKCLAIITRSKARRTSIEEEWQLANLDELPLWYVTHIHKSLIQYRKENDVLGFDDFLDEDVGPPMNVSAVFIDEAQDLSSQQWAYIRRITPKTASVVIAGDDDQAIYAWAGANPDQLHAFYGERMVLPRSYRLPRAIQRVAESIIRRVKVRFPKDWEPRDADGEVQWSSGLENIDLRGQKTWLLLARRRKELTALAEECRRQGIVYRIRGRTDWSNQDPSIRAAVVYERLRRGERAKISECKLLLRYTTFLTDIRVEAPGKERTWEQLRWKADARPDWMVALDLLGLEEREYIRALRRSGESLSDPGRVELSTVHGVKGGEADEVVLVTDVGRKVGKAMTETPDHELRVLYVAVTRAKERLTFLEPRSNHSWVNWITKV